MNSFLSQVGEDLQISLHVKPGAKKTVVIGVHGERLKVYVAKPPENGKANQELIDFFAELLHKSKSDITIVSGQTSKFKKMLIARCSQTFFIESIS